MPVPSSITDLSTTPSLNSPAGSESPGILDDIQRAHAAFIATLHGRTSNINNTPDASKPLSGPQAAAMQTGVATYGIDTGVANAYKISFTPAITTLIDGMSLRFKPLAANAGPSTLVVGSPGAAPIVDAMHNALQGGEIIADGIRTVTWNASIGAWVLATAQGTGRLIGVRKITASGTYTPTPGTKAVLVELVGGGGAGGYAKPTTAGGVCATSGGSAGGYAPSYLTAGFDGVMVTIGEGGIASTSDSGVSGGTTSFGSLLSATGGPGAPSATQIAIASFADIQPTSMTAGAGIGIGGNLANESGEVGGLGMFLTRPIGGQGGRSHFGAGGSYTVSAATPGKPASNPGAGGGGCGLPESTAGKLGGNGAAGMVIVWEYA